MNTAPNDEVIKLNHDGIRAGLASIGSPMGQGCLLL
jgi:hypothetical protein